jgi:glycosyltransferase involved in cell wall biosynthesis
MASCSETLSGTALIVETTQSPVVKRLLVITSVVHYRHVGQWWAYGPYVREIEVWCDLCEVLEIAAACRHEPPPGDALPFRREQVVLTPIVETGGNSWLAKLSQVCLLPLMIWQLIACLRRADAVHVRCPGNLGLLGVLLAPLFTRRLIAKYAGQWTGYPGEAFTYRLQRKLLSSQWWGAPVTVYGQWPHQPTHVIPFFSTAFTPEQLERAQDVSERKQYQQPPRVLFVGRLSAPKNVATLLEAIGQLKSWHLTLPCTIVGEGPERERLEKLAESLNISQQIEFMGGCEFDQVLEQYERADILVLASETEGFPKAILEGMAFGLACIGSNRGFVPTMLDERRGLLVTPGNVEELAAALRELTDDLPERAKIGQQAAHWARRYSLAHLAESLREIFVQWWPTAIKGSRS